MTGAIANSGIPRDELFVTTKMWVLEPGGEDNAKRAFENSRRRLGLDHVDLYLIESWGPFAEGKNNLFADPLLSEIGDAHDKSVAQVVLRWLIQRGVVVIPKSVRAVEQALGETGQPDHARHDLARQDRERPAAVLGGVVGLQQRAQAGRVDKRDPREVEHDLGCCLGLLLESGME